MRRLACIVLALCTALLSVSCSKERTGDLCFGISTEDTKLYLDKGFRTCWNAKDLFSISYKGKSFTKWTFQGKDGAKTGVIKGQQGNGPASNTSVALYPYDRGALVSGRTLTTTIPSTQAIEGYPLLTAVSEDDYFIFRYACSFICMEVTADGPCTIGSVTLSARGEESLCGKVSIDLRKESDPAISLMGNSNTVTLDCGKGIALSDGETRVFIASVAPVSLSMGYVFEITLADGSKKKVIDPEAVSLQRGALVLTRLRLSSE